MLAWRDVALRLRSRRPEAAAGQRGMLPPLLIVHSGVLGGRGTYALPGVSKADADGATTPARMEGWPEFRWSWPTDALDPAETRRGGHRNAKAVTPGRRRAGMLSAVSCQRGLRRH